MYCIAASRDLTPNRVPWPRHMWVARPGCVKHGRLPNPAPNMVTWPRHMRVARPGCVLHDHPLRHCSKQCDLALSYRGKVESKSRKAEVKDKN